MSQPTKDLNREDDPLIRSLLKIIIYCIKFMAILMIFVIFWSILDVIVHLIRQLNSQNRFEVDGLIHVFGSFLAVLIAIEIFINIAYYLRRDAIHVPLVISTALTAISRKVIILENPLEHNTYLFGLASVIFAIGLIYWLVTKKSDN